MAQSEQTSGSPVSVVAIVAIVLLVIMGFFFFRGGLHRGGGSSGPSNPGLMGNVEINAPAPKPAGQ